MISKERVRHMTKLAAFEEREGKKYHKMTQYFRRDYVGLELIKSFFSGTLAFGLILMVWAVCGAEELMNRVNQMNLVMLGIDLIIWYLIFLAVYLLATYVIYNIRYTRGRKKIRLFYNRLKKVSRLYESESGQSNMEDFE